MVINMKHTLRKHSHTTLLLSFVLFTTGYFTGLAAAQNPELQQRVADVKESSAKNKQALASYSWTETITISLKGEQKKQERFQVAIRQLAFPDLPPRKVLQILSIGAWTNVEIGQRMLECGKSVEAISIIVRGKVQVTRDDGVFGELVAGHIVGSALLLSGVPADVDAVVVEPVRCMRWEVEVLDRYLAANPETRIVLQKYLARDLAGKVLAAAKL
jgi:hypothetical protein